MARSRKQRRATARAAKREARRAARLRNTGPDESGNFGVNPYAARGQVVEVAPKELRSNPNSTQFPKRIATQRMIDRYHCHGHITAKQWAAGCRLWELFHSAGWNPRVVSTYNGKVDNETTHSAQLSHRIEAADAYLHAMKAVPYRCKGVVAHVVVIDSPASDWARIRGYGARDSQRRGMERLRAGLSALVEHFRY